MSCEPIHLLLGRYHDGELSPDDRSAVEAHLAGCPACAGELAAIAELAEAVLALPEPEPPGDLWPGIARRLAPAGSARRFGRRVSALAAMFLAGLLTGWFAHPRADREQAQAPSDTVVDLGPYLDGVSAEGAGDRLSPQDAAHRVGFQVVAAPRLPEGYCLRECCLCQCGCCPLVACQYFRGTDPLVLVQCGPGQAVAYGNRPHVETQVNGRPARLVQGDGRLAVSWQSGGTTVNLIGPDDLAELARLVAYVDGRLRETPKPQ
jgi:hypothetical protein